jgi:hypothetical protein
MEMSYGFSEAGERFPCLNLREATPIFHKVRKEPFESRLDDDANHVPVLDGEDDDVI